MRELDHRSNLGELLLDLCSESIDPLCIRAHALRNTLYVAPEVLGNDLKMPPRLRLPRRDSLIYIPSEVLGNHVEVPPRLRLLCRDSLIYAPPEVLGNHI